MKPGAWTSKHCPLHIFGRDVVQGGGVGCKYIGMRTFCGVYSVVVVLIFRVPLFCLPAPSTRGRRRLAIGLPNV